MINVPLLYVDGSAHIGSLEIGGDLELVGTLNCRNGKIKVGNTEISEAQL